MARRKAEYEYTFAVVYSDGTESRFYEIGCNRQEAFDALYDELDDRVRDHVKSIRVINRVLSY